MMTKIPNTSWINPSSYQQQEWVLRYLKRKNHPLVKAAPPTLLPGTPSLLLEFIKNSEEHLLRRQGIQTAELELPDMRRLMERAWRVHQTRSKKSQASLVTIEVTKQARTRLKSEAKRSDKPVYRLVDELAGKMHAYKREIKSELNELFNEKLKKANEKAFKAARLQADIKANEHKSAKLTAIMEKLSSLMEGIEGDDDGEVALVPSTKLAELSRTVEEGITMIQENSQLSFSSKKAPEKHSARTL